MAYVDQINTLLIPARDDGPLVLDLFAGSGGLALGFEAAGFRTLGFEMNDDCCHTYNRNLAGRCQQATLTKEFVLPSASVLIGGPPCQPFSVGGHQHGLKDSRDGFPIFLSAVEQLQPDIFVIENVRGLLYRNKWYLDEILTALRDLEYIVEYRLLNAVNFGVPQNRERIVIVGHRGLFSFPEPLSRRVPAFEAIGDLADTTPPESRFLTPSMDSYVAKYERASKCRNPRDLNLSKPARTLTCRNLAGATGDMQRVRLSDGRRRRLLIREAARLQSFPDWFEFTGGETSQFNQIGNAVSPLFAYHLAQSVMTYLKSGERLDNQAIADHRPLAQLPLMTVGK